MDDSKKLKPVTVTMLGKFSLSVGDSVLTDESNRSLKLWNVLAYLFVHRDRSVSQTELIEQFWQEENRSNPASAVKTLLFRARAMLEPLFGPEVEPILSHRGAYSWNQAIPCTVDTEAFTDLCTRAGSPDTTDEERMKSYRQAVALYRGDFLPKLSSELWTIPLATSYHAQYLQAVYQLAKLLEVRGEYGEMSALCAQASLLDPLDEELHILSIRSLLRQGNSSAALAHYEMATDLLYRTLGVRPSPELRSLYDEIMSVDHMPEADLELIQSELREAGQRPGAFVCEYGFFKECYRLEARQAFRTGACVHICLMTVTLPGGESPLPKILNIVMDQICDVLTSSLRQGDVVSKYSAAQYVVMLHAANYENSVMVMERVLSAFQQKNPQSLLKLTYKIRALD